jgi:putative flippase GtrA
VSDPVKPWTNRLVEFAVGVLAAALMLSWAWALLRPLLPVMAVAAVIVVAVSAVTGYIAHRWRYW